RLRRGASRGDRGRSAQARCGGLPLADAAADRGGAVVALGREGGDSFQGRGLGLDAGGGAAPAGLGRPAGASPGLPAPGALRSLPAAAPSGAGRLPLRAPRERAGAASLRLDRDDPRIDLSESRLLRLEHGTIDGWKSRATVSSVSSASTS